MEGTRNEKIVLIVTSYIIGFVTAFIAYGVQYSNTEVVPLSLDKSNTSQNTGVVQSINSTERKITVAQDPEGLFVMTPYAERILSANKNSMQASAIASLDTTGFYYKIIDAEPSRNGEFVYFCEQLSDESTTCDSYVYSLIDDLLHLVRLDGGSYEPQVSTHSSLWTSKNMLMLDNFTSATSETPWLLTTSR